MRTKYNANLKTTRSRMASLLTTLYDSARTTFTTAEAAQITGLTIPLASSLLHKASKRGLVSQLKRGLFVIVPPELGSSAEYSGNPYLVARYLVLHFINTLTYYFPPLPSPVMLLSGGNRFAAQKPI